MQCALGVGFQSQRFGDKWGKIAGHLTLQEGSAGNQRDIQFFRRFHDGHDFSSDRLIAEGERFGHPQIEWQLYKAKVMIVACDFFRNGVELRKLHGVASASVLSEAVPSGHAVELNFAGFYR